MKMIFLITVIILYPVIAYCQSATAVMNYEKGTEALESKNYKEAISFLTLSINEFPTNNAFYNRAFAFYLSGDTCSFCNDLNNAKNHGDTEASDLYTKNCMYSVIRKNISDSIRSEHPTISHFEIIYEKCLQDSTVYVWFTDSVKINYQDLPHFNNIDSPNVFMVVDNPPIFDGGDAERFKYLAEKIRYPQEARESGIQGIVYVTFIIEQDGSISNVKILRSPDKSLSKEAIRLVKSMPKWKHGTQSGKPVRVQFNMPLKFTLSD